MLLLVTMIGNLPWVTAVAGLLALAALGAGFGVVQLWRMPPETRPLFRTRRVTLAMATAYGSVLIVVIATAAAPASALGGTLLAGCLFLYAVMVLTAGLSPSSAGANRISQASLDALTESGKHDVP
jgi:hypothetical protein